MATAGRFAAISEEEIAKIFSEKDAENTKVSTNSAVKCLQQYLLETNADSLNFDDYSTEELAVLLTKKNASFKNRCSVNKTIMAILVDGHPELSTCEGGFPSG